MKHHPLKKITHWWRNRRQPEGRAYPAVTLPDRSRVTLLQDGAALDAARVAISRAQQRIWMEVYIFSGDHVGKEFAALLAEKAREGLDVRLSYDAVGSLGTRLSLFEGMEQAGVKVKAFHPLLPWRPRFCGHRFQRDHRKLLVVDDTSGGLGGMNIGRDYGRSWMLGWRRGRVWRDTAIGVQGLAVARLAEAFQQVWEYPESRMREHVTVTEEGFDLLEVVPGPDHRIAQRLERLVWEAREEVLCTMAYFAPPDGLLGALKAAVARGVRVRMVMPGKSDVNVMMIAARSFYAELLAAGVEIYERRKTVLHAKTLCVDGKISLIGSTNLDYRSLQYNYELSVVVKSDEFGAQMREMFEDEVKHSRAINAKTWRRRPRWDRATQATVRLFRSWL